METYPGETVMSQSAVDRIMAFVLQWEGGFVDHPLDPGGPTNMGVSLRWLRDVGIDEGDVDGDGDVDANDIRSLDPDKVVQLFKDRFWRPQVLDELPDTVAMAHFDCSVNTGLRRSGKILQKVCNMYTGEPVAVDGAVGPKTRARVQHIIDVQERLPGVDIFPNDARRLTDTQIFALLCVELRNVFYKDLSNRAVVRTVHGKPVDTFPYRAFYKGWINRTNALAVMLGVDNVTITS